MKAKEVMEWLNKCGSQETADCEHCPYNRDPYEEGCGKLLTDAAVLLAVFCSGDAEVGSHK